MFFIPSDDKQWSGRILHHVIFLNKYNDDKAVAGYCSTLDFYLSHQG